MPFSAAAEIADFAASAPALTLAELRLIRSRVPGRSAVPMVNPAPVAVSTTSLVIWPISMASKPFFLHQAQNSENGICPAAPGIRSPIFMINSLF